MTTLIVNYGMGNLGSVSRALEECGADVLVSENPDDLACATHVVLPGVGAFRDGMTHLSQGGWVEPLTQLIVRDKFPLLGICLGMQLLADIGHEGGKTEGLGWIPGEVGRLNPSSKETRIPHIGWNEVHIKQESPFFSEINSGHDFYFVHTYHFTPRDPSHALTTTPYCGDFVSSVQNENILGVQFHPEKSSRMGLKLLQNFLNF